MELIKEVIDDIPTAQDIQVEHCPYCGKEYKLFEFPVFPTKVMKRYCPDCNCQQLEEQREMQRQQEVIKQEQLKKRFDNSMMTNFFLEKRFNTLDSNVEPEIFLECKKYAFGFVPKASVGIQMIGNVGTGKTTLLAAICNELMQRGYTCLFTTLSNLLDKFSKYSYDNNGDISLLLHWLCKYDFIVLDDIGRETYTDKRKEIVFRIIDTLMTNKVVTAFTANPEMIEKIKQIPEFAAALDRLKGMCKLKLIFQGNSLRC